jgi:hypothetical protein
LDFKWRWNGIIPRGGTAAKFRIGIRASDRKGLNPSQRDCINQPRVGAQRLPWVAKNKFNNPEGVGSMVANVRHWMNALQPLQG